MVSLIRFPMSGLMVSLMSNLMFLTDFSLTRIYVSIAFVMMRIGLM